MIFLEDAPSDLPPELTAYLRRMFSRINNAIDHDVVIKQWDKLPPKPAKYTIVAFKNAIPGTTVAHPGIYCYNGTEWHPFP